MQTIWLIPSRDYEKQILYITREQHWHQENFQIILLYTKTFHLNSFLLPRLFKDKFFKCFIFIGIKKLHLSVFVFFFHFIRLNTVQFIVWRIENKNEQICAQAESFFSNFSMKCKNIWHQLLFFWSESSIRFLAPSFYFSSLSFTWVEESVSVCFYVVHTKRGWWGVCFDWSPLVSDRLKQRGLKDAELIRRRFVKSFCLTHHILLPRSVFFDPLPLWFLLISFFFLFWGDI